MTQRTLIPESLNHRKHGNSHPPMLQSWIILKLNIVHCVGGLQHERVLCYENSWSHIAWAYCLVMLWSSPSHDHLLQYSCMSLLKNERMDVYMSKSPKIVWHGMMKRPGTKHSWRGRKTFHLEGLPMIWPMI